MGSLLGKIPPVPTNNKQPKRPPIEFEAEWFSGNGGTRVGLDKPIWFPGGGRPNRSRTTTTSTTTISSTDPDGGGGVDEDGYFSGDIAFILASMALVFLMIPGLGFFYSGLARKKNALSLITLCLWSVALVSVQWFVIGYSLVFSGTGSFLIGNFDHIFLQGVSRDASPLSDRIPAILFALYQSMFASITPALVFGGAAERCRFLPASIFILLWTTFVYDFLAFWTWNSLGWAASLGGLDFAGGTPVHISSGAGALAYGLVLGRRSIEPEEQLVPHNMTHVCLGTALLWFGWFGFNGGSALSANSQAVFASFCTNLSACVGGIVWVILDYRHNHKYSALGFCTGAVAGLVTVTPSCGYISPASSLVFGLVGAIVCHIAVSIKDACCYCCDDALDVFAIHGIGGITGNILTGIFAQKEYADIDGGGLDGNWMLIVHQLIDSVTGFAWSFIVSLLLLLILNIIPGLKLRVDKESEQIGLDLSQHGEHAYHFAETGQRSIMQDPHRHVMYYHQNPAPVIDFSKAEDGNPTAVSTKYSTENKTNQVYPLHF